MATKAEHQHARKFIGIELDLNYFNIALDRIEQAHNSN